MNARGTGFLPNIDVLSGSTNPESVGGSINKERILSMIGRINYNFKRKFIFEASFRRDGSSKFSRETRWGSFSRQALHGFYQMKILLKILIG